MSQPDDMKFREPVAVGPEFRLFFDLCEDLACFASSEGRFIDVNEAFVKTLGHTREELVSVPFFEFVHPEDQEKTKEVLARQLRGEGIDGFRNRYRTRDGQWVTLEWRSVWKTEGGPIIAIARDVTRREEEARTQERYLRLARAMQRIARIGGWELDLKSNTLFWTDEVFLIHELPVSDQPPSVEESIAFYHPDDVSTLREALTESLEKGTPWNLELRIITAKGNHVDVRVIGEPIKREETIAGLSGTLQDITAEKSARDELQASRERFREVIDLLPQGIYARTVDGRFILANKTVASVLSLSVDQLVGLDDSMIGVDERTLREARERDREVSESGEMHRYTAKGPRGLEKAGRVYDLIKIPFPSVPGEPSAVLTVAEDVTRRRHLERRNEFSRRIAASLTETRSLYESGRMVARAMYEYFTYDAFFIDYFDEIQNVVVGVYNEDTPLGSDTPEPIAISQHSLNQYETRLRFSRTGKLINREVEPVDSKFIMMGHKNRFSRSMVYAPIRWADKVVGVISVQSYTPGRFTETDLEDLEVFAAQCGGALSRHRTDQERRLLEEQLSNARRLESLGVMAGGIAHDFNNLLTGIIGNAELALLDVRTENPAGSAMRDVIKASQRAADLCNQMLAYAGQGSFAMEEAAINGIVSDTVRLIEVNVSPQIRIRQQLDRDVPDLKMDVTQVRQIMMNLVLNGADAIGDQPGEITIRTGLRFCTHSMLSETWIDDDLPAGEYVFLEVRDSGKGMDETTLNRIFDPFFTTKFTGRGLGLASVLGIVRSHSGAVSVKSSLGAGTVFTVFLPALKTEKPQRQFNREQRSPSATTTKLSQGGALLFVDDDSVIRAVVTRFLSLGGFTVLTGSDGVEGVELFKMHSDVIDAVILDMTMPRMGGVEALAEIRKIRHDVPVLVSSGYSAEETADRLRNLSPVTFVQKPYKPEVLVQRVHDLLTGVSRHA